MTTTDITIESWRDVTWGGEPAEPTDRYLRLPSDHGYSLTYGVIPGYAEHLEFWAVWRQAQNDSDPVARHRDLVARRHDGLPQGELTEKVLAWATEVVRDDVAANPWMLSDYPWVFGDASAGDDWDSNED